MLDGLMDTLIRRILLSRPVGLVSEKTWLTGAMVKSDSELAPRYLALAVYCIPQGKDQQQNRS